jgi:hypothetical protein
MPVVKLTWDAPDGPLSYAVLRSIGDSLRFVPIAKTDMRFFYDRAVTGGQVYYYTVRSFVTAPDGHVVESESANPARINLGTSIIVAKGVIAGTVRDDATGMPVPGVPIRFFRQGPGIYPAVVPTAYTDRTGFFKALLDTGTYLINADPPPYMPPGPPQYQGEWFDNVKDRANATPVLVDEGKSFLADFGLSIVPPPVRPRGVITGTVIDDATLKPIRGALIRFHRSMAVTDFRTMIFPPPAATDSQGVYRAVLDTGTYFVRAEGLPLGIWPGYRPEWFDNVVEPVQATPVVVVEGGKAVADFGLIRLQPPSMFAIEGLVTDTLGVPLRKATVLVLLSVQQMTHLSVWPDNAGWPPGDAMEIEGVGYCRGIVWRGSTDSTGHYKAAVPAGGRYIAMAARWGYVPEYYKERPNPMVADVLVADGPLTGIDFTLALLPGLRNSISGWVRDSAGNGVPSRIILFPVRSWLPIHSAVRFGHTDADGAFTVGELRAGRYFLLAVPFQDYAPSFYKAGAFGVLCWKNADTVGVSGDVGGVDIGVVPLRTAGVGTLAGRVVTERGLPLEGVRVFAALSEGTVVGFGLSDGTGAFVVEGLPAGVLTLTFDRDGYVSAQRSLSTSSIDRTLQIGDLRMNAAVTVVNPPAGTAPEEYLLHQNYPNPFNPSTTITFDMPAAGIAGVTVFNMLGQEIVTLVDGAVPAGRNQTVWNGIDRKGNPVAGGIYFVKFSVPGQDGSGSHTQVRKMTLLK